MARGFVLGSHRVATDDGLLTYEGLAVARFGDGCFYLVGADDCPVLVVPSDRLKGYVVGVGATMALGEPARLHGTFRVMPDGRIVREGEE